MSKYLKVCFIANHTEGCIHETTERRLQAAAAFKILKLVAKKVHKDEPDALWHVGGKSEAGLS